MKKRSRIFINASTVLISGGYYLTLHIINAFIQDDSFELYIACPSHKKYSFFSSPKSHIIVIPKLLLKRQFRMFLDWIWLPKLIRRINPDIVYSLSNLPARTRYRQIHLHDNPYFLEDSLKSINLSFRELALQNIRNSITRNRLKFVDILIVQSSFYKNRLSKFMATGTRVTILSPSTPELLSDSDIEDPFLEDKEKIKILCLSRYYEHKNIEILLKVGKLIKEKNYPFKIYLSLNEKHHKNAPKFLRAIEDKGLKKFIVNIGQIPYKMIGNYVKNCDAMILPSLLESFSLNYLEAWHFQKPLFISNTEANKSACKNAALYFDPYSAEDILTSLLNLRNPEKISTSITNGNERVKTLSNWHDYVDLVKKDSV